VLSFLGSLGIVGGSTVLDVNSSRGSASLLALAQIRYSAWTKLTEHPGERGNPSLQGSQKSFPLNRYLIMPSLFLLRLIDGTLSTDHCHVFKLFLIIFLG